MDRMIYHLFRVIYLRYTFILFLLMENPVLVKIFACVFVLYALLSQVFLVEGGLVLVFACCSLCGM